MGFLLPENVYRAQRLQTLIDDIKAIQQEIIEENKRVDALEKDCEHLLEQLVQQGLVEPLDDYTDKLVGSFTVEEKEEYEALMMCTKELAQISNNMLWITFLVGGSRLIELGGYAIIAVVRRIAAMKAVQAAMITLADIIPGLVHEIKVVIVGEALATAAYNARCEVTNATKGHGIIAPPECKTSRILKFLERVGNWLNVVGPVLVSAAPVSETIMEHGVEDKLVDFIHETQIIRLIVKLLASEIQRNTLQMNHNRLYLSLLCKGKKAMAVKVGDDVLQGLKNQDDIVSLDELEAQLRLLSESPLSYHKDDLSHEEVVRQAELGSSKARRRKSVHFDSSNIIRCTKLEAIVIPVSAL